MTLYLVESGSLDVTCVAKVRSTPAGEIELLMSDDEESAYGPVEIAWYADRLVVTARGAGPASITETHLSGEASQDVVVEIRLPRLGELPETVPGAD